MSALRPTVAALLALSLVSCGGGKKPPEGPVTLTLYHWMEKDRTLWEQEIIKPFEESHPGIRVKGYSRPPPARPLCRALQGLRHACHTNKTMQ